MISGRKDASELFWNTEFFSFMEEMGIEALPKGQCFFRHFPTLPYGSRDFADR